jgi:Flp pilus assembly protein TadB
MAQTKRKRKSKHRGNAAGMVEARGRTSRPSGTRKSGTPPKKRATGNSKADARANAREQRLERYDVMPTWSGSAKKAVMMAAVFGVILFVINHSIPGALAGAALITVMYLPLTYYTDRYFYHRRKRQKQGGGR